MQAMAGYDRELQQRNAGRYRDYLARIAGRRDCRWAALVKPGTLVGVGHVLIVISEAIRGSIDMQLFEDPQLALRWVRGEID